MKVVKRIILTLILAFIASLKLSGQNLIPNSGFEDLLYCNTFSEHLYNAANWIIPEQGPYNTPDFFHSCNINPDYPLNQFAQPYTWPSFQYPHTGEGFCGMFWGANVVLPPIYYPLLDTIKEYTHVSLLTLPDTNLDYCVGMYVGSYLGGSYFDDSVYKYLGVYLDRFTIGLRSLPPVYQVGSLMPSDTVLFLTADDGAVLRDTQNFALVRTPYRPRGNEQYFIIGNMLHDVDTEYEMVTNIPLDSIIADFFEQYNLWGYGQPGTGAGYFYFDDVFFQAIHPPQIWVHDSEIPGKVWLVDTTTHEEKRWYKTGDDFVISTSDSVLVDAQQGASFTVQTRNCRLEYTDTLVLDFTLVQTLFKPQVRVFPNPATSTIGITYPEAKTKPLSLEMYNLSGQRVLQHQQIAPKESIEISQLPAGLYLLRFVDELGNVATEKIVVE